MYGEISMEPEDKYDPAGLTRARYKELLHAEAVLLALEAGGVDNWEWYEESLSNINWTE